MSDDKRLRRDVIRLAHGKPELRKDLLPLLRGEKVAGFKMRRLPEGRIQFLGKKVHMGGNMLAHYWNALRDGAAIDAGGELVKPRQLRMALKRFPKSIKALAKWVGVSEREAENEIMSLARNLWYEG